MKTTLFALTLILPVVLTLASITWLKPILHKVLAEICGTSERAEFWIRSVLILSVFGALILALAFGPRGTEDLLDGMRRILILTLSGGFIGVAWVARTIWRSITACPETCARPFAPETEHMMSAKTLA